MSRMTPWGGQRTGMRDHPTSRCQARDRLWEIVQIATIIQKLSTS
jgi:hypothetical protein